MVLRRRIIFMYFISIIFMNSLKIIYMYCTCIQLTYYNNENNFEQIYLNKWMKKLKTVVVYISSLRFWSHWSCSLTVDEGKTFLHLTTSIFWTKEPFTASWTRVLTFSWADSSYNASSIGLVAKTDRTSMKSIII